MLFRSLTDILGAEDAFGDMDFKVAGTKEFVTALQLDTKLDGIPASVLAGALHQAKEARLHILGVMNQAIDTPDEMSLLAPRIISIQVPVDSPDVQYTTGISVERAGRELITGCPHCNRTYCD